MDSGGISMISARTLPTESVGNIYSNAAYEPDSSGKKGSSNNLSSSTNNVPNGEKTAADAYTELPPPKRDSSTVEFSLPSKVPSRERLKSISEEPYRGMGKEELLRFSSRPLWRNLRYVCMSIVLAGWLALLITVVALVLTYPKCQAAQERDWWQKTVIYRIYVRSFYDHGNDGIGDINGIRAKLGYLQDLGVNTISLSSIYKLAPGAQTDTHIVNHTDIDPVFGTLDDLKLLINDTHSRGMHITLDFIPHHTSDEHPWFNASKSNHSARENEFRSYYVWAEGGGQNKLQLPNNWKSVYECPAWERTPDNTFYLHQFMASQPDLNLRSAKVRDALEDILRFWLDLGIDGFYIRHSDFLFEDYDLRDNVLLDNATTVGCQSQGNMYSYSSYTNEYTRGLTEVFDMFARWRAFLDDYGNRTNHYRILFADVDGSYEHVMNYYGMFNRDGVDFPLNKFSLELNTSQGGQGVERIVAGWMNSMPEDRWANWMGGDDRSDRLADRLGEDISGPYLMLSMLLPGTPYLYYGDEIGLRATLDPLNSTHLWSRRKPMRGPMLWNNKTNADFCREYCVKPWLDMHPDYKHAMNVEAQKANPQSIWNLFRNLTSLRKDKPSFEYGDYIPAVLDEEVFSFVREFDGEKGYLVALNFADRTSRKHYTGVHSTVPGSATVEIVYGKDSKHSKGGSAGLDPLTLTPYEGIVVSWDYKAKEL